MGHLHPPTFITLLSLVSSVLTVEDAPVDFKLNDVILHGTERNLTGTDRLAILNHHRGDFLKYVLHATGEECVLRRFTDTKEVERCESIPRVVCKKEFVFLRKVVTEACGENAEFCETFHRNQTLFDEIVVCEPKFEVACDDANLRPRCDKITGSLGQVMLR